MTTDIKGNPFLALFFDSRNALSSLTTRELCKKVITEKFDLRAVAQALVTRNAELVRELALWGGSTP